MSELRGRASGQEDARAERRTSNSSDPSYTLICTATDYDAWRVGEAPVTVEEVVKTLTTNAGNSRAVAAGILEEVQAHVAAGELDEIKGSMRFACITRAEVQPAAARQKFAFILPEYFS